jgi:ribosomal protein S8
MVKSSADYNMYIYKREDKLTVVLLYVDDLLLTSDSEVEVQRIKWELMTQFKMSNLGEVQTYLGVVIVRTKAGIWMH